MHRLALLIGLFCAHTTFAFVPLLKPTVPAGCRRTVIPTGTSFKDDWASQITTKPKTMSSLSNTADSSSEKDTSPSVKWWKRLFAKPNDGLTFRQRLAKAGLSVALSYGWVSNVSYSFTVSAAWFIFNKNTGLSPLAPGQWKNFLAVYAGFYVLNNFLRPIRFGISVGVSTYFDKVIKFMQDKFRVNKGLAIGLTVFLFNVVGTTSLMSAGIVIASTISGVPVFPIK